MKKVDTVNAVGAVLCHDITQIIKDVKKDAVFRKGHIVREEDIEVLLSVGKDHLYVWEKEDGMIHENEAAEILFDICKSDNMSPSEIKEGKIDIHADVDGLLNVDVELLNSINSIDEIMIATVHSNFPIKKGDKIAGTRVIPLVIEQQKMDHAKEVADGKKVLSIKPFMNKTVGIVTTGNEVFYGRIKDSFGPVIRDKLSEYDAEILGQKIVTDNEEEITDAIMEFINNGADFIICTGGMSVDPDDTTPSAIKNTGAEIVSYGAPILPGAMLLVSYYHGEIPIIGLPGCVMYAKRTVFDLILPRIMAGDKLSKQDLVKLGHGGLCLNCNECHFPICGFGK